MIEYSSLAFRFAPASGDLIQVAVEAPAGGASETGLAAPNSPHLADLLFPAAASWRDMRSRAAQENGPNPSAREIGERLFGAILRGHLLRIYDRSVGALERLREQEKPPAGLRLQLCYDPRQPLGARIDELPWELLCDPLVEDGFLCLDPRTPVVRSVQMAQTGGLLGYSPPLRRILVAIASPPPGFEKLDADTERQRIEDGWRFEYSVEIEVMVDATADRIRQQCQALEYEIFHFIGHGERDGLSGESRLIFPGKGRDQVERISGKQLAKLLKGRWPPPRLVFLNACHSGQVAGGSHPAAGVALELLNSGVPAAIGMKSPIADTTAIKLCGKVYQLLGEGAALEEALGYARLHVRDLAPGSLDWAVPALYVRGQPGRLFSLPSAKYRRQPILPIEVVAEWTAGQPPPAAETSRPKLLKSLQKQLYVLLDDFRLEPGELERVSSEVRHEVERRIAENLTQLGTSPQDLLELGHLNLRFPHRAIVNRPELQGGLDELHRKSAIYSSHALIQLEAVTLEKDRQSTEMAKTGFLAKMIDLLRKNRLLVENGRMSLVPSRIQQMGRGLETLFMLDHLRPVQVLEDPWSSGHFSRPSAAFTITYSDRLLPTEALLELTEKFSGEFARFQQSFRHILDRRWQDDDARSLQRALETVEEQVKELDARYRAYASSETPVKPASGALTVFVDPEQTACFADAIRGLSRHFQFFPKLEALPDEIRRSPFFIPWLVHREESAEA